MMGKIRKKVQFNENLNKIFSHPYSLEADLIKYRSKNSVVWSRADHYRYSQLLEPVLRVDFRNTVRKRNNFSLFSLWIEKLKIEKHGLSEYLGLDFSETRNK